MEHRIRDLFFPPAVDNPYGYDRHETKRAWVLSLTCALMLFFGMGVSSLFLAVKTQASEKTYLVSSVLDSLVGILTKDLVDIKLRESHIYASLILLLALVMGIIVLRLQRDVDKRYLSAYTQIQDFYTREQVRSARRLWWICCAMAAALAAAGILVYSMIPDGAASRTFCGVCFWSAAIFMFMYGFIMGSRVDIAGYNYAALEFVDIFDLEKDNEDHRNDRMIAEKKIQNRARVWRYGFLMAGCGLSLFLYYQPSGNIPMYWIGILAGAVAARVADRRAIRAIARVRGAADERVGGL